MCVCAAVSECVDLNTYTQTRTCTGDAPTPTGAVARAIARFGHVTEEQLATARRLDEPFRLKTMYAGVGPCLVRYSGSHSTRLSCQACIVYHMLYYTSTHTHTGGS
jgi:hypothetical protein